jgi:threonine synthase
MTYFSHLECAESGEQFPGDSPFNNPSTDGDVLMARYDLDRVRSEVTPDDIANGPASLWRYAPMLPVSDPSQAVTLGEGWTPLLSVPTLGRELGCSNLYYKDEGRNPSGTFKDRGATVCVSRMRELGVETVVHSSSGNAGAAWALYSARAGIKCVNLLAHDVLPATLQQSLFAGADTYLLDGDWSEAGPMVSRAAERHGWFNISTLKEPYRMEGKKTMGYEICEQLGWELPDVIVYPTGGALGALAIFKAFEELKQLGWVKGNHTPRLVVVQYAGCAPIVKAFQENRNTVEPWENLDVPPGGLKSVSSPGGPAALRLLNETKGSAIAVETEEAMDAVATVARLEGLFPCPESATVVAGLKQGLESGDIGRDERVVLMATGSAMKSTPILSVPEAKRVVPGEDI